MNIKIINEPSLLHRFLSSFATLGMLALCAFVSSGSVWWTFVTGVFFVVFCAARIANYDKNYVRKVTSKEEFLRAGDEFFDS